MTFYKSAKRYAKNALVPYVGQKGAKYVVKQTEDALFRKSAKNAKITPAVALKGTPLKSYLDRSYQKKCGIEVKHYQSTNNTTLGTTAVALSGLAFPLNNTIALGTSDYTRTGASIEIKKIRMRCTLQQNSACTTSTKVILLLVKCGNQASGGALPNANQIFFDPTNVRSEYLDRRERNCTFTIVSRKDILLSNTSFTNSDRKDFVWDYNPKTCSIVTWTDSDTAGSSSNVLSGALQVYAFYETLGTAGAPTLYWQYEFQYIDA